MIEQNAVNVGYLRGAGVGRVLSEDGSDDDEQRHYEVFLNLPFFPTIYLCTRTQANAKLYTAYL